MIWVITVATLITGLKEPKSQAFFCGLCEICVIILWTNYIMANSRLTKKITSQMSKREITKYERLMKEADKLFDHMDKVQRAATQYGRKIDKPGAEPTAAQKKKEQKMINAGFRAMYFAHKKDDELCKFKKDIKKKYP